MQVLDDMTEWSGSLPVALAEPAGDVADRRARLRRFAGCVLGGTEPQVVHLEGSPPRLAGPGAWLSLSSASRDGLAAFAAHRGRIGVDVERATPGLPIPSGVLHPEEARALDALAPPERALAFATLWACKEAYLKALGTGLAREPSAFRVTLAERAAVVSDGGSTTRLVTTIRRRGPDLFALALAAWPDQPSTGSTSTA